MNLKSGKLLWPETIPASANYPALEEDLSCECLVIGGGIAGALCASELNRRGVDTVLVEKRRIGAGSTSANTGILQFANDKSLSSCIASFGEERGVRFYRLCLEALNELERLAGSLPDPCEFRRRDCLYFASSEQDLPPLKREFETLRRHGFPVSYLTAGQIGERFSFRKPGGIYSTADAELHPLKFTRLLIKAAADNGLRVYENTGIQGHRTEKDHSVFYTANGRMIKARKAVIAAGCEAQLWKRSPNVKLAGTYAVATQQLDAFPGWPGRCLLWETARPYVYIRTTVDGRIIAGGKDEPTSAAEERDRLLERKKELLLEELRRLFPQLEPLRAEYCWTGTICATEDGLPLIGPQEEFPHCCFVLAYGGNGTVYSTIASRIAAGLVTEGTHPDAGLFGFDRVRPHAGTPV